MEGLHGANLNVFLFFWNTRPKVREIPDARPSPTLRNERLTDDCCLRGVSASRGRCSGYSPGRTHSGGVNGLTRNSSYQCTASGSNGTATDVGEGPPGGSDGTLALLAIPWARALGVLGGAPDAVSLVQFYTWTLACSVPWDIFPAMSSSVDVQPWYGVPNNQRLPFPWVFRGRDVCG